MQTARPGRQLIELPPREVVGDFEAAAIRSRYPYEDTYAELVRLCLWDELYVFLQQVRLLEERGRPVPYALPRDLPPGPGSGWEMLCEDNRYHQEEIGLAGRGLDIDGFRLAPFHGQHMYLPARIVYSRQREQFVYGLNVPLSPGVRPLPAYDPQAEAEWLLAAGYTLAPGDPGVSAQATGWGSLPPPAAPEEFYLKLLLPEYRNPQDRDWWRYVWMERKTLEAIARWGRRPAWSVATHEMRALYARGLNVPWVGTYPPSISRGGV
jgi:hypothetical protein